LLWNIFSAAAEFSVKTVSRLYRKAPKFPKKNKGKTILYADSFKCLREAQFIAMLRSCVMLMRLRLWEGKNMRFRFQIQQNDAAPAQASETGLAKVILNFYILLLHIKLLHF
jgi:hypothetical protein